MSVLATPVAYATSVIGDSGGHVQHALVPISIVWISVPPMSMRQVILIIVGTVTPFGCRYPAPYSSTNVNSLPAIVIIESGSAPCEVSSARMPSFFIMSRRRLTDA